MHFRLKGKWNLMTKKIQIRSAKCSYEKEPLKTAFGFKGSALTCLWQTAAYLESDEHIAVGIGVQSVLWSDASVYGKFGEDEGNRKMYALTEYAIGLCKGFEFFIPFELLDFLFPKIYSYAKKIIDCDELRTTFVLNALVPIDFAAWQLWAKENKKTSFDEICKFDGKHQELLANIPLITYNTSLEEILDMANAGTAIFKIKIGSDPNKNNNLDEMLSWDKNRILEIHNILSKIKTSHTVSGNILYYLDANGRYDTKERLMNLLEFAGEHGILERIILLEEPFDENNKINISDLPVCVAADESAHSVDDVKERFNLGYKALTLKPIAKTLSMTIRMADYARKQGMVCFCADLTVNPIMVSWNQNVASRLDVLPGMCIGVIESNGEQNYENWDIMRTYHPTYEQQFTQCKAGLFHLDETFYELNGGVFSIPKHFCDLIKGEK